jgi:hypothetical protein
VDFETIVSLIGATSTTTGLTDTAQLAALRKTGLHECVETLDG